MPHAGPPQPERPRCSVVVPVLQRADLAERCMQALARTAPDVEVVAVDAGPGDAVAPWLAALAGRAQHVRGERGLRHAGACNRGAAAARGELLLFLDPASVPLEGWLEPLVAELDADPAVGIAGAKRLYPNGTVEHAGVLFALPDAAPYPVFRGAPSRHPAVERRRELRAVSAECMLVRRALFEALGGFATVYGDGLDDIDLCLRARSRGATVVYRPDSVVLHVEEPGARRAPDSTGLERFLRRWSASNPPDEVGHLLEDGLVLAAGAPRSAVPVGRAVDRARWERVAELERRLAARGLAALAALPPDAERWPDHDEALAWGERVCGAAGLAERAAHFRARRAALARAPGAAPTPPWLRRGIAALRGAI